VNQVPRDCISILVGLLPDILAFQLLNVLVKLYRPFAASVMGFANGLADLVAAGAPRVCSAVVALMRCIRVHSVDMTNLWPVMEKTVSVFCDVDEATQRNIAKLVREFCTDAETVKFLMSCPNCMMIINVDIRGLKTVKKMLQLGAFPIEYFKMIDFNGFIGRAWEIGSCDIVNQICSVFGSFCEYGVDGVAAILSTELLCKLLQLRGEVEFNAWRRIMFMLCRIIVESGDEQIYEIMELDILELISEFSENAVEWEKEEVVHPAVWRVAEAYESNDELEELLVRCGISE
jgi:hypothetical protein